MKLMKVLQLSLCLFAILFSLTSVTWGQTLAAPVTTAGQKTALVTLGTFPSVHTVLVGKKRWVGVCCDAPHPFTMLWPVTGPRTVIRSENFLDGRTQINRAKGYVTLPLWVDRK